MKCLVCTDTTLRYFDVHKSIIIQVDATWKGLGATLLQDGHTVTFSSKTQTPVEEHYANIECETFACVFGVEWSHTYICGCTFTVESDSNPLEQIKL